MKQMKQVSMVAGALVAGMTFAAAPGHAQHAAGNGKKPMAMGAMKTPAAVLKMADKHMAMLTSTVKSKNLKQVHEHAFAVRDAVKMLPAVSKGLPAANQTKLAIGVKTMTSLAAELDEAGDSGNQTETEALHKRFMTTMNAIKALYPASVRK